MTTVTSFHIFCSTTLFKYETQLTEHQHHIEHLPKAQICAGKAATLRIILKDLAICHVGIKTSNCCLSGSTCGIVVCQPIPYRYLRGEGHALRNMQLIDGS